MIKLISKYFKNTYFGHIFLYPIQTYAQRFLSIIIKDSLYSKIIFYYKLKYPLNLKNPKTFNEKIQWLKLNNRDGLIKDCTDKIKVRNYVAKKIGNEYLIPIILETDNTKNIIKENLPDTPFIIKTNHSSGHTLIVIDKNKINWNKIKVILNSYMKRNHYYFSRELQYKKIKPKIIIEKLLLTKENKIPFDIKFHCCNARVEFIQVDINRFIEHKRNIYDKNWNLLNCKIKHSNGENIEKPHNLKDMINIAEKLSEEFIYVRIDLYTIDEQIFFGEMTFTPCAGCGKFLPEEYDYFFGRLIDISCHEKFKIESN